MKNDYYPRVKSNQLVDACPLHISTWTYLLLSKQYADDVWSTHEFFVMRNQRSRIYAYLPTIWHIAPSTACTVKLQFQFNNILLFALDFICFSIWFWNIFVFCFAKSIGSPELRSNSFEEFPIYFCSFRLFTKLFRMFVCAMCVWLRVWWVITHQHNNYLEQKQLCFMHNCAISIFHLPFFISCMKRNGTHTHRIRFGEIFINTGPTERSLDLIPISLWLPLVLRSS